MQATEGRVSLRSSLHKDFIARCLRIEINCLEEILNTVENSDTCEDTYIREALKVAEAKLRSLIKYLVN